jgi:molecular chaperone GrpE
MNDREDVEGLLDRFRQWLEAARDEAEGLDRPGTALGPERDPSRPELGLIDLVEEFTALRHELKLQTKSGRGLLEQVESTTAALRQAIEQFRAVEPKEAQAAWAAGKGLAEALADLDEALDRGRRTIERARSRFAEEFVAALEAALEQGFRRQSWLRRRLTGGYHQEVLDAVRQAGRVRLEFFDSLLEGYGLIQNRLARVLRSEQIERIPGEGHPVDPERMTVLEVVEDPSRPPGTVAKELRRGFTWKGRLLRYAEVQAVSAARATPPAGLPGAGSVPEDDGELDAIGHATAADADGDAEDGIDLGIETDRNVGATQADLD